MTFNDSPEATVSEIIQTDTNTRKKETERRKEKQFGSLKNAAKSSIYYVHLHL